MTTAHPAVSHSRSAIRGTLFAASAAVLVAQLANALPGVLNGTFQQYFGTVGSQLTWITAAFMIPVVVFELTFGLLGDRFGHRRLVLLGAITIAAGSLVCALAPSVQMLWVGSAINGLGAGAMYPASLALVAAVTHTVAERAKAITMWAGCLSAGAVVAPLMGGAFAAAGRWQFAYAAVIVLGLLVAAASLLAVEYTANTGKKVDLPGQITFALGLILVLFALVQGPEEGWATPRVAGALLIGIALLIAFIVIELRVSEPLLRLSLFRNVGFSISSAVAVVGMFAFLGACFSFSMWLGPVQHQNPMYIGLLFLLLQGPAFLLIPVISRLMTLVSPRWLLSTGFAILAVGAFLGSRLDVADLELGQFILPALLIGLGFALTLSPMTALAINTVPRSEAGMASATTNLLRDLGFSLGPVLVGAIALSGAARQVGEGLATSALPAEQLAPAQAAFERGGPIGLNSLPPEAPGFAATELAMTSLGNGFATAFLVCAVSAAACALLVAVGLRDRHSAQVEVEQPASAPASAPTPDTATATAAGVGAGTTDAEGMPQPV